jgi:hypothetical protein
MRRADTVAGKLADFEISCAETINIALRPALRHDSLRRVVAARLWGKSGPFQFF